MIICVSANVRVKIRDIVMMNAAAVDTLMQN